MLRKIRGSFFAGLLVLIPMAVLGWLLTAVWGYLWRLNRLLPVEIELDSQGLPVFNGTNFLFLLIVVATLIACIAILGWLSRLYFGKKLLAHLKGWIQRIPVLGGIYKTVDQILITMASGNDKTFRRVVYVEFPKADVWTIAFVTGTAQIPGLKEPHLTVFVPAVPNPTAGFYLIIPESAVKSTQITVEEAFRIILSLGMAGNKK